MNSVEMTQEITRARRLQTAVDTGGFVPLSVAARATGVPLTTLTSAVKSNRVPAVRVQPGRWVVRIEAVKLVLGIRNTTRPKPTQDQLDRVMADAGLLIMPEGGYPSLTPFAAIDFDDSGPTLSQLIQEERRERERAISGE